MAFGPAILDGDILPDDVAGVLEAVRQADDIVFVGCGRPGADKSDHRHRGLLRARHERPCGCHTAEQRDEISSSHELSLDEVHNLAHYWTMKARLCIAA